MNALDEINALADRAPGFVWRMQTDDGNATSVVVEADDALLISNMSTRTSVEALADYVYRSDHTAFTFRQRFNADATLAESDAGDICPV